MSVARKEDSEIEMSQGVSALVGKLIGILGVLALGFLLSRPTLSVGWVLFVVTMIQISLSIHTRRNPSTGRAVPIGSTDCRHHQSGAKSHIAVRG